MLSKRDHHMTRELVDSVAILLRHQYKIFEDRKEGKNKKEGVYWRDESFGGSPGRADCP